MNDAVDKHAFEYLLTLKDSHSKVEHIHFESFEMQPYMKPSDLSNQQVKFIFQARSRMLNLRGNYKNGNKDLSCRACRKSEESQPHLLVCEKLNENIISKNLPRYEDLFGINLDELKVTASVLETNFKKLK